MAVITVRFYTIWRQKLGVDRVSLQADNVGEAIAQIEDRFGPRLREQLRGRLPVDAKIEDHSLILLNGHSVRGQHQTQLRTGDILHIFPHAAGG